MYPVSKAFLRAVPDCPKKKDKREQIRKLNMSMLEHFFSMNGDKRIFPH